MHITSKFILVLFFYNIQSCSAINIDAVHKVKQQDKALIGTWSCQIVFKPGTFPAGMSTSLIWKENIFKSGQLSVEGNLRIEGFDENLNVPVQANGEWHTTQGVYHRKMRDINYKFIGSFGDVENMINEKAKEMELVETLETYTIEGNQFIRLIEKNNSVSGITCLKNDYNKAN